MNTQTFLTGKPTKFRVCSEQAIQVRQTIQMRQEMQAMVQEDETRDKTADPTRTGT